MTTTPDPAVCGARHPDAVGGDVACELPAGHVTAHRAHTTPDQYEAWTDDAAGTPATNPCRSAGRMLGHIAKKLNAERAAHEAHRRQLAAALGQDGDADWPYLLRRAEQIVTARITWKNTAANLEADRDRLAAELAAARTSDAPWIRAYREDLTTARQRAKQAEDEVKRLGLMVDDYATGARQLSEKLRAERDVAYQRLTRARRAEATLTRVRDALAEVKRDRDLLDLDDEAQTFGDGMTDTLARIAAALGDDQPTPPAGTTVTSHTYEGDGGPCAADFYGQTCGAPRDDHDLVPEPEQPAEPEPDDTDLTADEARALADDLALQLYRAQDALAYVTEMCDIADREHTPITTTRVRDWLRGAQCSRQAGLVITDGPIADAVREAATAREQRDAEPELIPVLDYAIRRLFATIRNTLKEHQ